MSYMMDTHVFLWAMVEPKKLSRLAVQILENDQSELLLSSVVVWEIVIKRNIGKIVFKKENMEIFIHRAIEENGFISTPITIADALEMENLPMIHRDPFDRMLISQARVRNASLITADRIIPKYDINAVW